MNRLVNVFMNPALLRPVIQNTALFTGGMAFGISGYYLFSTIDSFIEMANMTDQEFDETIQIVKDGRIAYKQGAKEISSGFQEIQLAWSQYRKEVEMEKQKQLEKEKKK